MNVVRIICDYPTILLPSVVHAACIKVFDKTGGTIFAESVISFPILWLWDLYLDSDDLGHKDAHMDYQGDYPGVEHVEFVFFVAMVLAHA